jgi:hypothetical protein
LHGVSSLLHHLSVRIAAKSAAPEITTVKVTEEELATEIQLTKLPPTITVIDNKQTIEIELAKLPSPAVASPPTPQRPGRLPLTPRRETLWIVYFAVTKATMPTVHFWLDIVTIIFSVNAQGEARRMIHFDLTSYRQDHLGAAESGRGQLLEHSAV